MLSDQLIAKTGCGYVVFDLSFCGLPVQLFFKLGKAHLNGVDFSAGVKARNAGLIAAAGKRNTLLPGVTSDPAADGDSLGEILAFK